MKSEKRVTCAEVRFLAPFCRVYFVFVVLFYIQGEEHYGKMYFCVNISINCERGFITENMYAVYVFKNTANINFSFS